MSFPRAVGEIDLPWLRDRLRQRGVAAADRLRGFEAAPIVDQGMTSVCHVLTLDYDGDPGPAPRRLLAKFSLDIPPVQAALAANRGYEREVMFYRRFGQDAGVRIPGCYWADYDAAQNRCGLLLEFVDGARATNTFSGQVNEIEQVVDRLAPFHARWWGQDAALSALHAGQAPFMVELVLEKLPAALETIKSRYASEVGETLITLIEFWLPNAHRLAESEQRQPQTLCHGDLHREQILFPVAGGDPPCVIDWQLASRDTGPTDLAHLLVSGLRPDQRRGHERQLVERYHASLGAHGVTDYAAEDLWQSYRLGIARLAMFYMTAFAVGDVAPVIAWWEGEEKRRGHSFWDVICGWTTQALDDNHVLDHLKQRV